MSDATPGPSSQRLFATPPGLRLGPLNMVADGKARSIVVQMRAGRFHGFVVRHGEYVHGYVDRCPHAGVPLAQKLDDYLSPDGTLIACSFHGALFTIDTGRCIGGPCIGQHLTPWPVEVVNGNLTTAAATPLPPGEGKAAEGGEG